MTEKTRLCLICKQPIDPERVEGAPDSQLCLAHAIEIEKYGGEFRISSHHEKTSKEGSLKKNYGGISTRKVRNTAALENLHRDYEQQQHGG